MQNERKPRRHWAGTSKQSVINTDNNRDTQKND